MQGHHRSAHDQGKEIDDYVTHAVLSRKQHKGDTAALGVQNELRPLSLCPPFSLSPGSPLGHSSGATFSPVLSRISFGSDQVSTPSSRAISHAGFSRGRVSCFRRPRHLESELVPDGRRKHGTLDPLHSN